MKKIVMFDGEIETQQYFTYRLRDTFEKLGHEVLIYNLSENGDSLSRLLRFVERGNTAMVCFNFHGIIPGDVFQDEEDGHWFWDDMEITCYNIVVDHPFYYHRFLDAAPKRYVHISIDRNHDAYMKRFFPYIVRMPFLPLAGTTLDIRKLAGDEFAACELNERGVLPMEARPIDIVFTGNYTPLDRLRPYMERLGDEYTAFYQGILDEMLLHPQRTLEEIAEEHIRREIPEVSEAELLETFGNMIFLDLSARYYVRAKAVQVLVDAGLKVAVFGGGWDQLKCEHPENLIVGKGVDSEACLKMISQAKCSLNVMPWFKDGAHDRIFNSMLCGAVCITDDSIYLREILKDGENCILYDLTSIESMPEKVKSMLADERELQRVADAGYDLAAAGHTWAHRAVVLSGLVEEDIFA